MSVAVLGPSSARAAGSGAPFLIFAGEIAGASSYDHVILFWDERLDERVTPVASEFTVTISTPTSGPTPYTPRSAKYLLSGLAGPDSFIDPSGTTIMRLDLPLVNGEQITVNEDSSIKIKYVPGPYVPGLTPLQDLSLTPVAGFENFEAGVFRSGDTGLLAAIVDANQDNRPDVHGADRVALAFLSQIDPSSIPLANANRDAFVVMVTRGTELPFQNVVTAVEQPLPFRDLGMGIVNLVLTEDVLLGDTVTVNTPFAMPLLHLGGEAFDPIVDATAFLFLASDFKGGTVIAGGPPLTTSTGLAPTTYDPIATTVSSPIDVAVTINELQVDPSPTRYLFFGQQVEITASPNATEDNPFVFRFELDSSLLPPGKTWDDLVVLRNGVEVEPCTEPVKAVPTPCEVKPRVVVDGDIAITVRTMAASTWNFAIVRPYAFGGFLHPVDKGPVVNTTNAGGAIPVKFSLSGDRGMAIFAADSPASQTIACDPLAPLDFVEETTVSPGSSTLTYSPGTDVYTYVWKTDKTWAGTCRKLVITFDDGSTAVALFKFGK